MKPDAGGGEAGVEDESRREAWPGRREEERTGQRARLYSWGRGGCGRRRLVLADAASPRWRAWRGVAADIEGKWSWWVAVGAGSGAGGQDEVGGDASVSVSSWGRTGKFPTTATRDMVISKIVHLMN